MNLRKHQNDLLGVVNSIIQGSDIRNMVVHATPGAGKSALPLIAGRLIKAGLADALCWICPRSALQDQGERNFLDPFFRQMLGHNLTIRSSTNEPNPCRGQNGFITTYQALGVDDDSTVLREFRQKRYILVLDEFHHCEVDGLWTDAIRPLVEAARYCLFMSGTLERGDGKRIAFIPYAAESGGGGRVFRPALAENPGSAFIHYSRTDALRERAILPIRFQLSDGHVEWEDKQGRTRGGKLSHKIADASQALFTALSTEFADHLLRSGVSHWLDWKASNPRSKLLVVAYRIEQARKIVQSLRGMGIRSEIATSDDSPEAARNIKAFKAGLDCLVTVQVAYEGLDCPPITHIICLTLIRSVPWIEQCIARAVRVDHQAGPYHTQKAFVFAPDDFLFRQVVEQIRREQIPFAHASTPGNGDGRKESEGEGPPTGINPLAGQVTDTREISLGEMPGLMPEPVQTVREQEEDVLHKIEMHVRKFSFDNRYKPQRISAEIKGQFGKSRRHMTLDELKACLRWVRRNYPINGRTPEFVPDGVSRTRGGRQRVPTKAQPWNGTLFNGGENG